MSEIKCKHCGNTKNPDSFIIINDEDKTNHYCSRDCILKDTYNTINNGIKELNIVLTKENINTFIKD